MSRTKRKVSSKCDGLCKGWTNTGVFQQVNKASRTNIAIYQYYDTGDQKTNQSRLLANDHIIIVHNKSDSNISKNDILNEISKSMCKCPHCFVVLRHIYDLLNQLDAMKKNELRGICKQCRMHAGKYCNKCTKCRMVINDFLTSQVTSRDKDRMERLQAWINKVRDLLTTGLGQGGMKQEKKSYYSDTQLNKLLKMLKSPRSVRQLDIDVMDLDNIRRIESHPEHPVIIDNATEISTAKGLPEQVLLQLTEEEEITMDDFCIPEGLKKKKIEAVSKTELKKERLKEKALEEASDGNHRDKTKDKYDSRENKFQKAKGTKLKKRETSKTAPNEKVAKSDKLNSVNAEDLMNKGFKKEIVKETNKIKDISADLNTQEDRKISGSKRRNNESSDFEAKEALKQKTIRKGDAKDLGSKEKKDGKDNAKYVLGSKQKSYGKGDAKDVFIPKVKNSKENRDEKGDAKNVSGSKEKKDRKGDAKDASDLKKNKYGFDTKDVSGSKEKMDDKEKQQDGVRITKKERDNSNKVLEKIQLQTKKTKAPSENILSPSQVKKIHEQAEALKNALANASGANIAQSKITKFNEDIFRELKLDTLPDSGEVYSSSVDLILDTGTIISSSDSPKSKREGKTWISPRDNLKLPFRGIREQVASKVGFKYNSDVQNTRKNYIFGNREYMLTAQRTGRQKDEFDKMIVGSKICKYNPNLLVKACEDNHVPLLFKVRETEEYVPKKVQLIYTNDTDTESSSGRQNKITKETGIMAEPHPPKGVIRFELSDRQFIEKGWTMLPTEKIIRKMNIYRMRPTRPESDWFARCKERGLLLYETGERLAEFEEDGRARWFYRDGRTALLYYSAEEINAQQRYVVYSSSSCAPRECGTSRPSTVLASFDWLGNGVVFDHAGKIRLKYNQTEGVLLDRAVGPVTHWKWHSLNDPPVLQQVMIDTRLSHKEPEILKHDTGELTARQKNAADNDEMLAVEFDNLIKEKSKKLTQKYMPYQIKMKALKINEYFSLRILDQATVYLLFCDEKHILKQNIGMVLDHKEILDTVDAEVGEVSTSYDILPSKTEGLREIQQAVANAAKYEKRQIEKLQRIRRTERQLSIVTNRI